MQPLESRIHYKFRNSLLLAEALTHPSLAYESQRPHFDNQRMEFLGDAVLQLIVTEELFRRFPEFTEGRLTKLRSRVVSRRALARFAMAINLGDYVLLGKGEEATGGRRRLSTLADAFEALIGAVYLDSGLSAVEKFVHPFLEETQDYILEEIHDPKSVLQEWAQAEKLGAPQYVTISSIGPDHAKVFEVEVRIQGLAYGRGHGSSKHVAARIAAQTALEALGISYK